MKKVFFIMLFFFVIIYSCRKEIEIEFPEVEKTLVLNSLFTPDSVFMVRISETSGFNDTISNYIENADCKLFSDDVFLENLQYSNSGFYFSASDNKPVIGKNYKIEVSKEGYKNISATNCIPEKPDISNAFKKDKDYIDENGYIHTTLTFTINDEINVNNFYEVKVISTFIDRYDSTYQIRFRDLLSEDIVIKNEGVLDYYPNTLVFSDELFNGQAYTIKFILGGWTINGLEFSEYCPDYKLIVYIRAISEEMYKFKKKLIVHLNNQNSDIWNGIGEPVQMYSNIVNAYGIFAGYSEIVDTLGVEQTSF